MNKTNISNAILIFISCFLLIKTSEAPYFFGYSVGVFDQFLYGNQELFSVAASVLAAYIFYAVNIFIPQYVNRKKALNGIDDQLTQVIYRCMCLLYIYKVCSKYLDEDVIKSLCKIISFDLGIKISLIDDFSEHLTIDERRSINKIRASKDKFFMSERNLDVSAKKINDGVVYLVNSINLPSAHNEDTSWFKIEDGNISFIRESNTFKLILVELEQYSTNEAKKLPDINWFHDSLKKDYEASQK